MDELTQQKRRGDNGRETHTYKDIYSDRSSSTGPCKVQRILSQHSALGKFAFSQEEEKKEEEITNTYFEE